MTTIIKQPADHLPPWSDEWYASLMEEGEEAGSFAPSVIVWPEMAVRKAIASAIVWARTNDSLGTE